RQEESKATRSPVPNRRVSSIFPPPAISGVAFGTMGSSLDLGQRSSGHRWPRLWGARELVTSRLSLSVMIFHDMRFDQLEQHSLFRFAAERRLAGAAPRIPPRGSL